jgi:hypothetical protein
MSEMSDMKDFVDALDFERWAKANFPSPDFSGGPNGLNGEFTYHSEELMDYFRCWRCAREGYIPNTRLTTKFAVRTYE